MTQTLSPAIHNLLLDGIAIPACPLALTLQRRFDPRRQRALLRYYTHAGAGGVAVAVHTTQFEIRDPKHGLLRPVLKLTAEELQNAQQRHGRPIVRIGGIVGQTEQAIQEAQGLSDLQYHVGLLSLAGHRLDGHRLNGHRLNGHRLNGHRLNGHDQRSHDELIAHCRRVAEVIPLMGFYLQSAVGGCELPYSFWRRFAEIENVVAIKIAPFNRYQALEVVRAVIDSGRKDIALYTGNDDNIICDLLTEFVLPTPAGEKRIAFSGGLLGHWACWTQAAVALLERCKQFRRSGAIPAEMMTMAAQVTDCNAALFDAANGFRGCIAGIHEVLRRQGLLEGTWCLNPHETVSPGQADEIDRVYRSYPHMHDDAFVAEHLDEWLR
ncbi:dihydrodipicolinate synthetase [Rhodopirellula maiorica SM1]|uniref:Dihydrodipicolinate synthetase n=1 Tax=Rhodopirellula maiorica SM1 TaxID=1265738 RepID=M5REP3_9BACT|nr:dihydrodipicolinate synthetase [Rhodopirellula maiorica]EMI17938.1 dihydrodipicolinate synthetase [Rhodopirellula maiorica SM1]